MLYLIVQSVVSWNTRRVRPDVQMRLAAGRHGRAPRATGNRSYSGACATACDASNDCPETSAAEHLSRRFFALALRFSLCQASVTTGKERPPTLIESTLSSTRSLPLNRPPWSTLGPTRATSAPRGTTTLPPNIIGSSAWPQTSPRLWWSQHRMKMRECVRGTMCRLEQ